MRRIIGLVVALAVVGAACSSEAGATPSGQPAEGGWRTAVLRDVATGDEFRVADLQGSVVVIETMAIWCSSCRVQQQQARTALAQLEDADIVYISLDVDPNERGEDLADYAVREGFGWRFAVSSPEISRSLAAEFGERVLSPPSTPLIVLGPGGEVVEQHFGVMSSDDLAALLDRAG